jgi:uncharacterized 2Fe-2S/4Fe-4S cluster protein (DUF4445 family)
MEAVDFDALEEITLLVDIGTNGEMVLGNKERAVACSTAAGPAFEGSGLTMGVSAVAGAISAVTHENGVIHFTTIDNEKPMGICGSGILDALATFLELGLIEDTGRFDPDSKYAHYLTEYQGETAFRFPNTEIVITQKDISAIQLAKSAVRAGLETLLASQGLTAEDISHLYLAGGFGSYMSLSSATRIGLIPHKLTDKAVSLGNAAGAGAAMLVQNTDFIEKSLSLARSAESLTLSGNPHFSELFMEHMMFPD